MTDKAEKVAKFVQSDRTDYIEFLNSLEDERVDWVENDSIKKDFLDQNPLPDYQLEWIGTGIYGELAGQPPYHELDFEKFSYNLMQELVEDEDLKETMDAIMAAPENDKRKQLRVYLFESMKKPRSPYFNIEKYREILVQMLQAKQTAEQVIENQDYEVVSKTFDSFGFLAEKQEAEKLREQVNQELEICEMSLDTYQSVVSFYNVAEFQHEDGEWFEVKTGGTAYDDLKSNIVAALKNLDFQTAHQTIASAKIEDYNPKKLKEYNAELNRIKQEVA